TPAVAVGHGIPALTKEGSFCALYFFTGAMTLFVESKLVLELKCAQALTDEHLAQTLSQGHRSPRIIG
ncbi:MAG: GxxExxY protein, partial [Acidobacteria bacterium]|nr:GxxExxY protein [Acidobacteriota bacterium]